MHSHQSLLRFTKSATARHLHTIVNWQTHITAPRWEALTGPEMDYFPLILHEKLLFFGLKSGSVIMFSHTTSGRSAEATLWLASLYTPHHNDHHVPQASQRHHDAFTAKYQRLKLNFQRFISPLAGRTSRKMNCSRSNQPRALVSGHPGHGWPTI